MPGDLPTRQTQRPPRTIDRRPPTIQRRALAGGKEVYCVISIERCSLKRLRFVTMRSCRSQIASLPVLTHRNGNTACSAQHKAPRSIAKLKPMAATKCWPYVSPTDAGCSVNLSWIDMILPRDPLLIIGQNWGNFIANIAGFGQNIATIVPYFRKRRNEWTAKTAPCWPCCRKTQACR